MLIEQVLKLYLTSEFNEVEFWELERGRQPWAEQRWEKIWERNEFCLAE